MESAPLIVGISISDIAGPICDHDNQARSQDHMCGGIADFKGPEG